MLFSNQRIHKLAIPAHDMDGKSVTIAYLISYLCQNVMKDTRMDLFVLEGHMYVHNLFLVKAPSPRPHVVLLCSNPQRFDIPTPLPPGGQTGRRGRQATVMMRHC